MKPLKTLMIFAVIAFLAITVFSLMPSGEKAENIKPKNNTQKVSDSSRLSYTERIDSIRSYQQQFMATNERSPFITQDEKFDSLKYFSIDTNFQVIAKVDPILMGKTFQLETSDGDSRKYKEVASLRFTLLEEKQTLILLESMESDHYFLSFYDESSAISTYGAGRYLEVDYNGKEAEIVLDFNLAYNPYCAYVEGYSCPVPLSSNRITVVVEAGEKIYK